MNKKPGYEQLNKNKHTVAPWMTWKLMQLSGWCGLRYYNISKHRYSSFNSHNGYAHLSNSLVVDIVDTGGRKWICSNSGLYIYDSLKGITARYSSSDTGACYLPCTEVNCLYSYDYGEI